MLELDLKSRKSIYEQIVDGIKQLIVAGVYKKDDKLPSVRELASELTVNPNTIQKAFKTLESQGWIYMVSGRGCFVSGELGEVNPLQLKALYGKMDEIVRELLFLGVSREEIIEYISSKEEI